MIVIKFPTGSKTKIKGLGRNGSYQAQSLVITVGSEQLILQNEHTRGAVARGALGLPKDADTIRRVAAELIEIAESL